MLPFIEVSRLPSSSSFYSAVTQQLGLQYLYAADSSSDPQSITYGTATSPAIPIFELRHIKPTAERPLRLSRVVLSAASPGVVRRFQTIVQGLHFADGKVLLSSGQSLLRQSPGSELTLFGGNTGTEEVGEPRSTTDDWRLSVKTTEKDPDGNIMEVVYVPPVAYPESYSGSTVRRTNSSTSEVSRIMTWNYDVAAADPQTQSPLGHLAPVSSGLAPARRPGRFPDDDMAPVIRRTITTSTTMYEPAEPLPSPRQNSSGLTTGALVGTLLGVAAASAAIGAGVAYGAMKNERGRNDMEPPLFQRRSTYPEPQAGAHSRYSEYGPSERNGLSIAERRPPPTLLTRYPYSQGPQDDGGVYDDTHSRLSSRFKSPGTASVRTRSEVSPSQTPLMLTNAEHRSHVSIGSKHSSTARTSEMVDNDVQVLASGSRSAASSRHSTHTASRSKYNAAPSLRRSSTYDDAADRDRESYVSTRSHRTASTVRPLPVSVQTELTVPSLVSRPKAASRASGATAPKRADSYVSARETPREGSRAASRAASHISARQVALPASGAGSSRIAYEEEEDDLCSIAPSESISCVGSRKSARLYH